MTSYWEKHIAVHFLLSLHSTYFWALSFLPRLFSRQPPNAVFWAVFQVWCPLLFFFLVVVLLKQWHSIIKISLLSMGKSKRMLLFNFPLMRPPGEVPKGSAIPVSDDGKKTSRSWWDPALNFWGCVETPLSFFNQGFTPIVLIDYQPQSCSHQAPGDRERMDSSRLAQSRPAWNIHKKVCFLEISSPIMFSPETWIVQIAFR